MAAKSFAPSMAWHYLSEDQKERYALWRQQKDQGRAYYWLIQEEGNEAAGVTGQHYLRKSVADYLPHARRIVRDYVRLAWRS